jgi:maltooligosyltrehalose trehalohydrolase
MGQEYGDTAPLQYFISHSDPALVEAVQRGRREEFAGFAQAGDAPDPAARATFDRCVLNPELRHTGHHAVLHHLYRALLELRSTLISDAPDECLAFEGRRILLARRGSSVFIVFSFSDAAQSVTLPVLAGSWRRLLSSAELEWQGPGTRLPARVDSDGDVSLELAPFSFAIYGRADGAS